MRVGKYFLVPFLMLTFLAATAVAQENGELTGVVTDPNGAIIPNAPVSLTLLASGETRHTVTDNAGIYTFPSLRVGNYTLTVTSPGFQTYSKTDIVINVASTVKEDVNLTVGSNTQTVTVEANALQLQSETNEISDLITGKQVTELATNGRNVTQLAVLGLGVSNNIPSF
jgi:Carboxypeptidase regulatory-like domain